MQFKVFTLTRSMSVHVYIPLIKATLMMTKSVGLTMTSLVMRKENEKLAVSSLIPWQSPTPCLVSIVTPRVRSPADPLVVTLVERVWCLVFQLSLLEVVGSLTIFVTLGSLTTPVLLMVLVVTHKTPVV